MSSIYPTLHEILSGLTESANVWRPLAIFWHMSFAAFVIALILGVRPSKRASGIFLSLPFLSVSIVSFLIPNPFNGIIFAVIGIFLLAVSVRLSSEHVQIASSWAMILGVLMFIFGWIYPHFLDASSSLSFLYSAPVGTIPCATLSIGIGLALIMNSLNSRKISLILGIAGTVYGLTGFGMLGVPIDLILLFGAIVTLIFAFVRKKRERRDTK